MFKEQGRGQSLAARALVRAAAEALGGLSRVQTVRSLTMSAHGRYAWLFGGGRLSASPQAPERHLAAHAVRWVHDFESNRFLMSERCSGPVPYLPHEDAPGRHLALRELALDGDLAYDRLPPRRVPRWREDPQFLDGAHMRRAWMLNNPLALVRALLSPVTRLSAPRPDGEGQLLDVLLEGGERLSVGFSADALPGWIRWSHPHGPLGELTFTTHLSGYASIDGLLLPQGYDTRLDWRDIDYLRLHVDGYRIDACGEDLAAPAVLRGPQPPLEPGVNARIEPVGDHLWRLSPGGSTLIEFADHLTLFDLPLPGPQAKAALALARSRVPGKPLTELIISDHRFHHSAGLRQAVAEGLTIISRWPNEPLFQEMVSHPARHWPDEQARLPQPLKFLPVQEQLELADDTMRLVIRWVGENLQVADGLIGHLPGRSRVLGHLALSLPLDPLEGRPGGRRKAQRHGTRPEPLDA